ncbi:MAG: EAL domain-containing protein, partial [Actinomycetota bacterium]|nr:EAL domain-containing protein [Actinomycetota bacterium]
MLEQALSDHCAGRRQTIRTSRCRSMSPRTSSCPLASRRPSRRSSDHQRTQGLLTVEITERVFARDEKRAGVVLAELKDLGVKLALDAFGTGYSSLGYLNTLPIDYRRHRG